MSSAYPRANPRTGRRAYWTARALELRAAGLTHREVAAELGLRPATVRNYLSDPDGSKDRARKDSYRQPCPECGRLMDGSNGVTGSPDRCYVCEQADSSSRIWTRETIIAAIRRFAEVCGRPPTAPEFNVGSPGYPSLASIYRSSANPNAPFASWAEAVEAAGFPRPKQGRRTIKEGLMANTQNRSGYMILHEREDGSWEIASDSDEMTQVAALNAALNGTPPTGRWVAVPRKFWHPREIKPRTVYDWADAPA